MIHPLLHLLATRPQLMADHAEAYAGLFSAELADASALWRRRALLSAAALCFLGVAAVLGGVASMLWAVIPATQIHAPWALLAAPLLPACAALACLLAARADPGRGAFDQMRSQLKADFTMLREVRAG
jgi:hypothetical protein